MNGEHCALCLRKQGHVCYECCEDRHKLVKMELDELKARVKPPNPSGVLSLMESETGDEKMTYDILDLTREIKKKIKFASDRRETLILTFNCLWTLQEIKERYGAWRKKYEKVDR